jgi:isovaleryl-CoA dehydrogenase
MMFSRQVTSAVHAARRLSGTRCLSSSGVDIFNPSSEHRQLRDMVRSFAENEVDPQAMEFNREEKFNRPLFRKAGELGLHGITVPEEYGGSGMDAAAACIVHEELSAADPAFCLSYLAHSQLFVNNLCQNGSHEQKLKYLPDACSGERIGGMCMSEPGESA